MGAARILVLLSALVSVATAGSYYGGARVVTSYGCSSYRCGTNAKCTLSNDGRPVCSCLNLHMGDPLTHCTKVECLIDEDCHSSQTCGPNNKCINPCLGLCAANAYCETFNHVPACKCSPGFTGDPHSGCRVADPQAACKPSPCGANTRCVVKNEVASCSCLPGYFGSPFQGCRRECESDSQCASSLACTTNFKCESPCNSCGEGANCDVVNHQARCSCPANWLGSPYSKCYPECTHHSECPGGKPACINQRCTNPCANNCGINANCELRGITPVCSCPKHLTGNPFTECIPFVPADLCRPNPCGQNAVCTPGHDNTGAERPVCTCPTGYIGNALAHCTKAECTTDNECNTNRACINNECQNPCTGRECSIGARCEPRDHIAVCECLPGFRGDAARGGGCSEVRSGTRRYQYRNNY